ncbi:TnsD family Tn7-like transposition protein [Shewanella algae]|uniref:TnsD family Tn7-like transposition protein n=1 Tax=Shewanella algae TaxID=38313 RepID=UPI002935961D|nr:TnsD family Tn7-like transposition protein [Shewanella algae]MDV2963865.1 TnsD family Tn7-like transposition protein [Shewanella algae]
MLGFPLPYRDELLYSTIARHGVHSGIVSPKELLAEVFGDRKILATSDLPSHLKRIAALYPEAVGIRPKGLLYRNTLFPLYAPFVGEARRQALVHELTANGKSSVHLTAGAAASRVKQPIYLRYCPGCMREQSSEYGECYWRRDWQVAGVESCPVHGSLVDSKIRRHDVHRHQFQAADLEVCPSVTQKPSEWQNDLLALSIGELLNLGAIPAPEFSQWGYWYANLAADHRFNRGSQVRHDLLRDKVIGFWGTGWLSRYGLLPDGAETNWLGNVFRKHRKAFSYLEHLVVLHALMEPGWKLADVVGMVVRLESDKKMPVKEPEGTDNAQLEEYRVKWLAAVEELGTKGARLNGFGDAYAWLYRRDRSWLQKINRGHKKPEAEHLPKVDWHRRDRETVKTLMALRDEGELRLDDPRRSRNWYLNQLEHKTGVEKYLGSLPLCSLFFDRYCENISEYQIRRITSTVIRLMQDGESPKRWQILRRSGLSEERLTETATRFLKEVLGI